MALWLIRGGGRGDAFLADACEYGLAILGFSPVPDLTGVSDKTQLHDQIAAAYPERSKGTITRWTTEIGSFLWSIAPNDIVIMPYANGNRFWIGVVEQGRYRYRADLPIKGKHTRPVRWTGNIEREDLPDGIWPKLQDQITVKFIDKDADFETLVSSKTPMHSTHDEVWEGERRQVEQMILSRSQAVVNRVWERNFRDNNNIGRCEACGFRHAERRMFDVHHLNPIAVGGARRTRETDLAVLCPRCHRWAHLKAGFVPFTIAEIIAQLGFQ